MHEFGMCEGVVSAIERRASGRPVAAVGVRIGVLERVVTEAFQQAFEMVAAGTVAEGADVEIVFVPVRGDCRACGKGFFSEDPVPACPECASLDVATQGGDELTLEWLRYDEEATVGGERAAPGERAAAGGW